MQPREELQNQKSNSSQRPELTETTTPNRRDSKPSEKNFDFDKKHEAKRTTALDGKNPSDASKKDDSCGPCGTDGKSDKSWKSEDSRL